MSEPAFCVLVNPAAGGGRVGRRLDALLHALDAAGIDYQHHLSRATGDCRELAQAARQSGYEKFIAVGGDGTVNEVVNGILADPVPGASLAVVPWGTGNDWANYYGLPADVDAFVALLLSGAMLQQDVGRVLFDGPNGRQQHYFVNCLGTGFDSYLLGRMGSGRGSRLRYLRYVLKCLVAYRGSQLTLELNGQAMQRPTLMLEVCLGQYVGAGMQIAPGADTDNGVFEVVLIGQLTPWQLLRALPYLYNGRIRSHPAVQQLRCDHLRIDADDALRFQCDGELVGDLPARLEIVRGLLQVVAREPGTR